MINSIIISNTGDGFTNLATDEYILGLYHEGRMHGVALYFYVNDNAVIIGRNQNAWRECNLRRMEQMGVQLVRRHTGGGAVYHDGGNLNFSFITDEKHYDVARQTGVIASACSSFGIKINLSGRNDILADGRKFSGNAYAVWGRARGQHGTLLIDTDMSMLSKCLNVSQKKLEAKGVASVRARVCNLSELADITVDEMRSAIIACFIKEYGEAEMLSINVDENEQIQALRQKHASWQWRLGMTPAFDYSLEQRFSFGELQLLLRLKNGIVTGAEVFTDALDTSIPNEITSLILGTRFDAKELSARLICGGAEANELSEYILKEGL